MYQEEIKIPKDRIAVLIGTSGKFKSRLSKLTNTKIVIDSKEGIVTLESLDSMDLYNLVPIIKAIARGFSPGVAELLLNENCSLEILDMKEFAGNSKKKLLRLKSRCIGNQGKARENIEQMTNTHISIYGKTISIIGLIEDTTNAKHALEELLQWAPHGNVYRRIHERKRIIVT